MDEDRNAIAVMGQKIQTQIVEVDIFSLHYWKDNPRVNSIIKQKFSDNDISDSDIEKVLWEEVDSVKDLFQDIRKHGGLIDEILVRDSIVLEGNSRLCAYRHLYEKAVQKNDDNEIKKWSKIRARIIPKDSPDYVVFSILGTWHIKGKKEWDTYEKASYFKRMITDHGYTAKEIGDSISQTEKFVNDHIEAYDLMVENNIYTLEKFSYFYELVKNRKIQEMASSEPNIISNTIEAIKEGRFKRGEEIRHLPKVLKDKVARKEFFEGKADFDDALATAKDRHPEHEDSFYNHIKKVTRLIEDCSVKRIEEMKEDPKKQYLLEKLYKQSRNLCKKIGIASRK